MVPKIPKAQTLISQLVTLLISASNVTYLPFMLHHYSKPKSKIIPLPTHMVWLVPITMKGPLAHLGFLV